VRWRKLPTEDGSARLLRVGRECGDEIVIARCSAARPPVGGAAPWWCGIVPGVALWWRGGQQP
jgi:hypothetical protein